MESFLKACGATGPLFLQVEGRTSDEAQRKILDQPFALIGRDHRADLSLAGEQVSRRHAYLQIIGGTAFCVDLESRTGTHWDGQSRNFGWVYHDQVMRVGKHRVRLVNPASDGELEVLKSANPFNPANQEIAVFPSAALDIRNGSADSILWPLNRPLVLVGSSLECKIRLHGAGISRIHCSLVSTPRGVWAVDLRSPSGIFVNDKRVRFARLVNGDLLRIGSFSLRFCRKALAGKDHPVEVVQVEQGAHPPGDSTRKTTRHVAKEREAGALVPASAQNEGALAPALQQFAQMQNQMFDQFQQGMMMMFQMFSALQKEHMDFVRDEMSRIEEVSREMQEVQREMMKYATGAAPVVIPPSGASIPTRAEEPRRYTGRAPATPSSPMRTESVHADGNGKETRPAPPRPQTKKPLDDSNPNLPASEKHPLENPAPEKSAPQKPTPETPDRAPATSPPPPDAPPADIHAWLCERMANLQEERQTRWQKILGFFSKK
jgi:pSer/pThr/pTyr-binding forkhead associated (FHA) protein